MFSTVAALTVLAGLSLLIFGNGKPSVRAVGLTAAKESACS